jgi:two-component system alkaline phosphatase synthesis response regulator PhoP
MTLNPESRGVVVDGKPVPLSKTEFGVLQFLIERRGQVCTRRQIIAAVQGENYPATDRSVDVQIAYLRKKLGSAADLIETVRGAGFRVRQ